MLIGRSTSGNVAQVWVLECQPDADVTLRHERLHILICLGMDDPWHDLDMWVRMGVL